GIRPMEMVLLGLGGCTAFDMVLILKRQRQAISDCHVEVEAERATEVPKVFTKIHVHYVVKGKDMDPKKVERAVNMTAEKYCSVSIMLSASVELTHDFEIVGEQD
ncbi:MAG: OsmC family protein, partial [Gammaproteobacteria bacterium]